MKFSCILILILLVACSNQPTQNIGTPETGYPISQPTEIVSELPEGYPEPGFYIPPTILSIPTPSAPEKSTITGYLKKSNESPFAEAGAILYLVPVILSDDGVPLMAGLSRTNDPRALTDENGRFYFAEVDKKNHYVLILDRVREAFLLKDPRNDSDLIIFPQDSEIFDLGELVYSTLPN